MAKHRYLLEFGATPGNAETSGSDAGWTESFYESTDLTEEQAAARAYTLKNVRQAILTVGWRITAVRISRLDATNNLLRKGQLIKISPADAPGRYLPQGGTGNEQPWDAINLS